MNDVPFFYGDLLDAFADVRQVELNDLRSGRGWVKTSPEGRRQAGQARTGDPDRPGMGRPPSRNEMAIGRRRWWWRRVRTSDPSKTSEQKTPGHGHPVAGQQHHHNDLQASVFLEWQSALSSELDNSFSFLLLQMQWMLIVLLLLGLLTGLHKLGTYFPRPDGFSLAQDPNLWHLLLLLQIKSAPNVFVVFGSDLWLRRLGNQSSQIIFYRKVPKFDWKASNRGPSSSFIQSLRVLWSKIRLKKGRRWSRGESSSFGGNDSGEKKTGSLAKKVKADLFLVLICFDVDGWIWFAEPRILLRLKREPSSLARNYGPVPGVWCPCSGDHGPDGRSVAQDRPVSPQLPQVRREHQENRHQEEAGR